MPVANIFRKTERPWAKNTLVVIWTKSALHIPTQHFLEMNLSSLQWFGGSHSNFFIFILFHGPGATLAMQGEKNVQPFRSSNPRPSDYRYDDLPIELSGHYCHIGKTVLSLTGARPFKVR